MLVAVCDCELGVLTFYIWLKLIACGSVTGKKFVWQAMRVCGCDGR